MTSRVILINAPAFIKHNAIILKPQLGLLYLAAVLKGHHIDTRFFDFQYHATSWKSIEKLISETERCVVGFSCDSDNIHRVLHLSDRLLSQFPKLTIILGGHHVTHIWEPYVTKRRLVVRGEGEYPLLLLAKHFIHSEGSLEGIPGIVYQKNRAIHTNPLSNGIYEDIDLIPFPDMSFLPEAQTYNPSIITARGCMYDCFFCSQGSSNNKFRSRSIENIEEELISLKTYFHNKIPYLSFLDDTFTFSAQRVFEICDVLDRVFPDKSGFGFFCEGRVNILGEKPELIYRLKKAGLIRLQIGIESGDQAMLDKINKKIRLNQIEKVVLTCHEADVPSIYGGFICGLPGQTADDMENDIDFAKHLIDLAPGRMEIGLSCLSPLPGTEFRKNADKWGLKLIDEDFATGHLIDEIAYSETSTFSKEQLENLYEHFQSEVEKYYLEQAALNLSPHRIKELFIVAAERRMSVLVVKKLCTFVFIDQLLHLRRREDHRFLFEIAHDTIPFSSPLSTAYFKKSYTDDYVIINQASAMEFQLSQYEMQYLRYFKGKLSFKEIAKRVAAQEKISQKQAYDECMNVYMKCEDKLTAIVLV
jgi:anaerobic magnesium-protoporphyrin IX monomethyl ester cyclase